MRRKMKEELFKIWTEKETEEVYKKKNEEDKKDTKHIHISK